MNSGVGLVGVAPAWDGHEGRNMHAPYSVRKSDFDPSSAIQKATFPFNTATGTAVQAWHSN